MGDKSRRARRGKSKRGGRRQKTVEATNEMSDREKIKCKGSIMAMPVATWEDREGKPKEWQGGERCNVSKLSVASPKTVLEKIVNVEKMELQRQLEEARSEQSGEECFIESAIAKLQEKEKELVDHIEAKKKSPKSEPSKSKTEKPSEGVTPLKWELNSKVTEHKYQPAFSDDEDESNEQCKMDAKKIKEDSILATPKPEKEGQNDTSSGAERLTSPSSSNSSEADADTVGECMKPKQDPEFYYFYQVEDGQNIFIHPINVRCLVQEYGSLQDCPEKVTAQIVEMETHTMTQDLRKRYRYLSHLPVNCEFVICEMMLKPPVVSRETLAYFTEEFRKRKAQRQKKKREQRKFDRKVEERARIDSFGRAVVKPMPEVSLNLDSLEEFPAQNPQLNISKDEANESSSSETTSPPGSLSTPGSVPSIWASSSFAEALLTNKAPVVKPPSVRNRTFSNASGNKDSDKRTDDDFSEDEDGNFGAAPSFNHAFSEAFALSLSGLKVENNDGGNGNEKKGGKKKKEKKLLFSTGIVRKYQ